VVIAVTERKPDAVITNGSQACLAQLDGTMFHRVTSRGARVPLIEIAGCSEIRSGRKASSPKVRCALKVLDYARKERLKISKISVDPSGDICLNMESQFRVKLGQPDEISRKMTLLRRTLAYRPSIAREAIYVDLSCPSAPVWKPKGAVRAAS